MSILDRGHLKGILFYDLRYTKEDLKMSRVTAKYQITIPVEVRKNLVSSPELRWT